MKAPGIPPRSILVFFLPALVFIFSFSGKKKQFVPPGTVQITETFFADACEISNLSWIEYEYWTATKYGRQSPEYIATLPDTLVWRNPKLYNEPYVSYYHRHIAYKNFPVVGITFEQAQAFCKWRTNMVKAFYALRYKKDLKIEYRLPDKQEWEQIGTILPPSFYKKNKKQFYSYNLNYYNPATDTGKVAEWYQYKPDVTAPVNAYEKNLLGIYNLFGNVAEMTSQKGLCKGGSFIHRPEDSRPGKNIEYEGTSSWLGFRCVCSYTP